MHEELLARARQDADKAERPVRAAALLRIARASFTSDQGQAEATLLAGVELSRNFPAYLRGTLLDEARDVAAAVNPQLLPSIPLGRQQEYGQGELASMVQIMLAKGHVGYASQFLAERAELATVSAFSVSSVLQSMDASTPEGQDARVAFLRPFVVRWRKACIEDEPHQVQEFGQFFTDTWNELPPSEASEIASEIVAWARNGTDLLISYSFGENVCFDSLREATVFQVLPALRKYNPALAQACIELYPQLAMAAKRYPNGLESIRAEAEAKRVAEPAANRGQAYFMMGDPDDFERQQRLIDARSIEDFRVAVQAAMLTFRTESDPRTYNYAPKPFWHSTGEIRQAIYQAGKQVGAQAAEPLDEIPDKDLRLFATIELLATLAGVPAAQMNRMRASRPPHHN